MIEWNEITWYSKMAAILVFIGVLPAWSFYLGREYQKTVEFLESGITVVVNISADSFPTRTSTTTVEAVR